MYRKAFTFVEVLVAIAIVLILFLLALPAINEAKERGHQQACASNLHQIGIAISLYRTEHDGDGKYGTMYEMGLPLMPVRQTLKLPVEIGKCRGKNVPTRGVSPTFFAYRYVPAPPGEKTGFVSWDSYAKSEQENSLIMMDPNHNPVGTSMESASLIKKVTGLMLDGHLVTRIKKGLPWDFEWWK